MEAIYHGYNIHVCAVAATLAFVALAVQAILTLRQVRHTAKAVEYLALNADARAYRLDPLVNAAQTWPAASRPAGSARPRWCTTFSKISGGEPFTGVLMLKALNI